MREALWLVAVCTLGLGPGAPARADDAAPPARDAIARVRIDDVRPVPGAEDAVDVRFRVVSDRRTPLGSQRLEDVRVQQDGAEVPRSALRSLRRVGEAGLGVDCVLAVDTSRTMLGGPSERARARGLAFLERLQPGDRVALVTFSDRVEVAALLGEPFEAVRARLESLQPDRAAMSTAVFDGLHRAVEVLREGEDPTRLGFVVAFTDGRDGASRHALGDVLALASGGASGPRVPIFAIGYEGRGAGGLAGLERLASESGADLAREADAETFYAGALEQMRSSLVLRFATSLDGARHAVSVTVGGQADERTAFYPLREPPAPAPTLPAPHWQIPVFAAAAVLALLALVLRWRGQRRGIATLRCIEGPLAPCEFALHGSRTRLGALASNDVTLSSPSVSRVHAEIRREGDQFVIVDLESTNGTRVNGAPISSSPLRPGDRIRIGDVELLFEA